MSKSLKFGIFLLVVLCSALLVLTFFGTPLSSTRAETDVPENRIQTTANGLEQAFEGDPAIITAVETAVAAGTGRWAEYTYQVEHIQMQDDGQKALAWLAAFDLETGDLVAREPEKALAVLQADGTWVVLLDDDPKFVEPFIDFQYTEKFIHGDVLEESDIGPKSTQVFGGYYLPWAEGLTKRLTWSVGHTSCTPISNCTYAFDFADGTMFPLVAAKGGTVYHWRDTCANNNSSCTNSITLEDRSTTPVTYQIYLHIAHNSIPSQLKKVGAPVLQGQFIANVDNTGYSTGHHVHFMVVTEHTRYTSWQGYVFGRAEDITFRDVDINWHSPTQGGRPRLAYEAASFGGVGRTNYTSGNKPAFPPTGALTAPANKTYVTNRNMSVSGWGQDDIAVVKMEILARHGATDWFIIGTPQTANPFNSTVDLCSTTIPNGPFELALQVWDYEGNPSPIMTPRKLVKNVECGTAGTNPSVNLTLNSGTLALPLTGTVSAEVTRGSTNSAIASVEFWFHGRDWNKDSWVYLGKDTNGANGWQAPINTTGMVEASNYTILAVATDNAGNMGVDVGSTPLSIRRCRGSTSARCARLWSSIRSRLTGRAGMRFQGWIIMRCRSASTAAPTRCWHPACPRPRPRTRLTSGLPR